MPKQITPLENARLKELLCAQESLNAALKAQIASLESTIATVKQAILNDAVEIDTSREVQFVIIRTLIDSWED